MLLNYLAGIALGLALIAPIGPQNLYIINAGLTLGVPRVFGATLAATTCDAILITIGAIGAGVALNHLPGGKAILLAVGVIYLTYLAIQSLTAKEHSLSSNEEPVANVRVIASRAAGVSLLNPHAILDTTVAIGTAIAAQSAASQLPFTIGAITASLLWFAFLGVGAALLRNKLTPRRRLYIERVSGVILLIFALFLFFEVL